MGLTVSEETLLMPACRVSFNSRRARRGRRPARIDNAVSEIFLDLRPTLLGLPSASTTSDDCREVWARLVSHRLAVVASGVAEERAHLVLRENTEALPRRRDLQGRNLAILERHLLGAERKVLSMELGISQATIAQALKRELGEMGITCAPALVPAVLVMLLHAARSGSAAELLGMAQFEHRGLRHVALSTDVESRVWRSLSPAQQAVLRHRAHGGTHADIAAERRTSHRTIANQLAAASHRLGISGRLDLLQLMAAPVVGG